MSEIEREETGTTRIARRAAVLSLVLPGLGQIYCGTMFRGLAYMGGSTLVLALGMFGMGVGGAMVWFGIALCAGLGIAIVAAVEAYRLARRTRPDYRLKEYNHWLVYVLLFVISSGGGVAYAFVIRERFVQAFRIPNDSMSPTIQSGDQLLAKKSVYDSRDPERGEIVIFRAPDNRQRKYVKRVVAMPGEVVSQRGGQLMINGEPLGKEPVEGSEEVVIEKNGTASYRVMAGNAKDFAAVTVPPGHCFVLGDNRGHSRDSRHFGPVPIASMVGRAAFIHWAGTDWSRFGAIN